MFKGFSFAGNVRRPGCRLWKFSCPVSKVSFSIMATLAWNVSTFKGRLLLRFTFCSQRISSFVTEVPIIYKSVNLFLYDMGLRHEWGNDHTRTFIIGFTMENLHGFTYMLKYGVRLFCNFWNTCLMLLLKIVVKF